MGILYWLSSIPGVRLPGSPALYALFYWITPTLQNALHVPAYAAFAGAWCWALSAWLRSKWSILLLAAGISVIFGIFDEWHQSFVPGRYASITDVMLNVVGIALGLGFAAWANRYIAHSAASLAARDGQA